MKTDRQLQEDVLEELEWEPAVDAAEIGVTVRDGIVTLSGTIATYAEKIAAETATKRVAGVRGVAEELEVRLPSVYRRTDADLARAVVNALEWNVAVPQQDVKVKVEDGWVTLDGEVSWGYQREAAATAVRELTGIRGVSNRIVVRPAVLPGEIRSKIAEALKRYAARDAAAIQVESSDGKVTLRGRVHSWLERDEVARAAWSAPGVSTVENLITVTP
jgi:osmotically-inducible protein OsmY